MRKMTTPEERGWDRARADTIVDQFLGMGFTIEPEPKNVGAYEYRLVFKVEPGKHVSVRMLLADWQVDSDVVIANIFTFTETIRRQGHACRVVAMICAWAHLNKLNEVRATQVAHDYARRFWKKNRFMPLSGPDPTSDYIRRISY